MSHARLTAEISPATAPILLLDEIAAHLDPGRRAALFAILDDLNCQAFMTGTEAVAVFQPGGRAQFLTVSHGSVSADRALTTRSEPLCLAMTQPRSRCRREELERYARHIVLPEIGGAGQQRLKRARVLVIGAGGLGAPVLEYLAAAGVGTLGIVDDDVVSLSNLQRQVIHDTAAVGAAKTRQCGALRSPASTRMSRSRPLRDAADGDNAAELMSRLRHRRRRLRQFRHALCRGRCLREQRECRWSRPPSAASTARSPC